MSLDLVKLALQYFSPDLVARLAQALAIDRSAAQKAVAAVLPAILDALASTAATAEGAGRLSDAADRLDPATLRMHAGHIGGPTQGGTIDDGTRLLSGIVGSPAVAAMTTALASHTGLGADASRDLIGLTAPAVLGMLADAKRQSGLDARSLAAVLAGQRDIISRALPAEFARARPQGTPTATAAAPAVDGSGTLTATASTAAGTLTLPASRPSAGPLEHRRAGAGAWTWMVPLTLLGIGAIWALIDGSNSRNLQAELNERIKIEAGARLTAESALAAARADAQAAAARSRSETGARQKAEAELAALSTRAEADAKRLVEREAALSAARSALDAAADRHRIEAEALAAKLREAAEARQQAESDLSAVRQRADAEAKGRGVAEAALATLRGEADATAAKLRDDKEGALTRSRSEAETRRKLEADLAALRSKLEAETRLRSEADATVARLRADIKRVTDAEAAALRALLEAEVRLRAEADAAAARSAADSKARSEAGARARADIVTAAIGAGAAARGSDLAACQNNIDVAARSGQIRFETASATLSDVSHATLERLAGAIKACPGVRIRVEGHTDAVGTPERNQALSDNRAQSVADYLVKAGLDARRLTAIGYGQTKPIASNDTAEGRALNRRIEFVVEN